MGDDSPKRPLEYDRGGGTVSIRGMRLLIVLTLINTMLLTWFAVVGMQGPQMIQQRWRQWQEQRRVAKVRATAVAQQRKLMSYAFAAGTVVYTEDPARMKALGPSHRPIRFSQATVPDWQPPMVLESPPEWIALRSAGFSIVGDPPTAAFIHERATPSGEKRLVTVQVEAMERFQTIGERGGDRIDLIESRRRLYVDAYSEINPADGSRKRVNKMVELRPASSDERSVTRSRDGTHKVQRGPALTLFAGLPDPSDATHLTVGYEIDGRPGTIDIWLNDHGLVVKPRQALAQFDNGQEAWELGVSPATAPSTRPAGRP